MSLSSRGRIFEGLYFRACNLFHEGQNEESYDVCRRLIQYPDLSDIHKAGCHLILALSSDNYVYHAEQALDLYENLYVVRPGSSYRGDFVPTHEEEEWRQARAVVAQQVLAKARTDESTIQAKYDEELQNFQRVYDRLPTDLELVTADDVAYGSAMSDYHDAVDQAFLEHEQEQIAFEQSISQASTQNDDDAREENDQEWQAPLPKHWAPINLQPTETSQASASAADASAAHDSTQSSETE